MAAEGRKLLIAVDESPASDRTLAWALDNLLRDGDAVHLLHVIPPGQRLVVSPDLGVDGIVEDDPATKRATEEHALAFLRARFEDVLRRRGVPYDAHLIRCDTSTDSIGQLVVSRAAALGAAAIVMAKHNKGMIKEFFVGSTTSYVVAHARVPVVVLHND